MLATSGTPARDILSGFGFSLLLQSIHVFGRIV